MDPFSYLSVLISIVLALGMTRVLAGIGEMLQAGPQRRIYWVHALWILNLFLFLVISWWIFYRWRNESHWTYFLFVFVLISPTILYLAAVVLFPPERTRGAASHDYRKHFYANHRSFFLLFLIWVPVDVTDTLLKGTGHFISLGPEYIASAVIMAVLFSVAAFTPNPRFHACFAVYFNLSPDHDQLHLFPDADVTPLRLRGGIAAAG
jgi:hypothetical protein